MKKIFLLCALAGLHIVVKAQKVYFIYLQSENATPFYVRLGGQIQSSSTEGYLIIPNLRDSTYQVSIGQPGKQAEPRFSINISKADRGFLIRTADGTINLFDLQTLAIYKPISTETTSSRAIIRTDNFTRLLALVADDSTLLTEPMVAVAKEQTTSPKEAVAAGAVMRETVSPTQDVAKNAASENVVKPPQVNTNVTPTTTEIVTTNTIPKATIDSIAEKKAVVVEQPQVIAQPAKDTILVAENNPSSVAPEGYKKSTVTKKSESSTSEGFGLVFLDEFEGRVDTVQITIPNPGFIFPDTTQKQPSETKQFLDISPIKDTVTVAQGINAQKSSLKAQCSSLATDDDFFKLRRDMTAKTSDDEMIAEAKKYFKVKCYRTEQIKYLTALFLTEESKYHFFDAAYMHVSDQDKFQFLQAELKDNYYINRFKALIAN